MLFVIAGMGHQENRNQLHDLLKSAANLRDSAAKTTDSDYVDMFLRAAFELEERANRLASNYSGEFVSGYTPKLRAPLDLHC